MQPWVGPHWREDSLIHQREWAAALATEKVSFCFCFCFFFF
jgi:hypothetical protein